ncbi:DNA polymerase delta [Apiospora kogelbergensis]|uniref:DNA polymerase delta n=1 Tax=Apiospora kogelbergensis TaxID=1337665 RepID=A0AAW0R7J0_9PEZI
MPTTRRSTRSSSQAGGKQATLSFHNRVTKAVPKSSKNNVSSPSKQSPLSKHVISASQEEEEAQAKPAKEDIILDDVVADSEEGEFSQVEEDEATEGVIEKSDAELRAGNITGRHVDQYWRKLEGERIAKRVHQEDLSQAEKVLRYFDVSSQYGPCVGISRLRRWQRADKLGLNPPPEVLAVLVEEEQKNTKGIQKAHIDVILNSTAVGIS